MYPKPRTMSGIKRNLGCIYEILDNLASLMTRIISLCYQETMRLPHLKFLRLETLLLVMFLISFFLKLRL